MEQTALEKKPKRRGRRTVPESEKLVLVAGKIPPAMRETLISIMSARDWSMSDAIRAACGLLVKRELPKVSK